MAIICIFCTLGNSTSGIPARLLCGLSVLWSQPRKIIWIPGKSMLVRGISDVEPHTQEVSSMDIIQTFHAKDSGVANFSIFLGKNQSADIVDHSEQTTVLCFYVYSLFTSFDEFVMLKCPIIWQSKFQRSTTPTVFNVDCAYSIHYPTQYIVLDFLVYLSCFDKLEGFRYQISCLRLYAIPLITLNSIKKKKSIVFLFQLISQKCPSIFEYYFWWEILA